MSQEEQEVKEGESQRQDARQPSETMEATRVTTDEVKERMARGEPFVFIDTRNPAAWGEADTKLPGAIHVPANEVEQHIKEIPHGRAVITYCT